MIFCIDFRQFTENFDNIKLDCESSLVPVRDDSSLRAELITFCWNFVDLLIFPPFLKNFSYQKFGSENFIVSVRSLIAFQLILNLWIGASKNLCNMKLPSFFNLRILFFIYSLQNKYRISIYRKILF